MGIVSWISSIEPPERREPRSDDDYIGGMRVTRRDVDAWLAEIGGEVRALTKGISQDRTKHTWYERIILRLSPPPESLRFP